MGLTMSKKRRIRRLWEDDEKIRIVAQTRVPGVSVSQVARRYDVNANLVFTWLRDPRFNPPPVEGPTASFLPVEVVGEPKGTSWISKVSPTHRPYGPRLGPPKIGGYSYAMSLGNLTALGMQTFAAYFSDITIVFPDSPFFRRW